MAQKLQGFPEPDFIKEIYYYYFPKNLNLNMNICC